MGVGIYFLGAGVQRRGDGGIWVAFFAFSTLRRVSTGECLGPGARGKTQYAVVLVTGHGVGVIFVA